MPTLVPRRTRRRRRCRTLLRRALSGGRTVLPTLSWCVPEGSRRDRVGGSASLPLPARRPDVSAWQIADDPPRNPRRDCSVSRRRSLDVPRDAPKGFPFSVERLAVSVPSRRAGCPQPVAHRSAGSPKGSRFPLGGWCYHTDWPEGHSAPDRPKAVVNLLPSIVVAPLDASTPKSPRAVQGPSGPRGARRDLPDGRIWQIPQNLGPIA